MTILMVLGAAQRIEYLIFHKTIEVDTSIDVDEDSDADDSPFYVRYGSNN